MYINIVLILYLLCMIKVRVRWYTFSLCENIIILSKLIGLLILFCHPLLSCPHQECMSSPGARVLTWRKCPQLAYASSTGVHVRILTWRICRRLDTKNHAPTIPGSSLLKAWTVTVVWTNATKPCHSKIFQ